MVREDTNHGIRTKKEVVREDTNHGIGYSKKWFVRTQTTAIGEDSNHDIGEDTNHGIGYSGMSQVDRLGDSDCINSGQSEPRQVYN